MRIKASDIEKAVNEQCAGFYPMSLVAEGMKAVERAVNVGIDACLEACNVKERGDSYEFTRRPIVGIVALDCKVSAKSLPVLLRRLTEDEGPNEDGDDWEGPRLASDILGTLGWHMEVEDAYIVPEVDEEVKDEEESQISDGG